MINLNTIYCEDCLDTMRRMDDKSVDIILTSPPYNKSRTSKSERALQNLEVHYKEFDDARSNDEYRDWTMARFAEFGRILSDKGVVAYNLSYATDETRMSELMWLVVADVILQGKFTLADAIVWKKKNAVPNNTSPNKLTRICEYIFIFCKRDHFEDFHANKRFLYRTKTGQKIYEPFYNIINAENNDGLCEIHKATYSTNMCVQVLDRYGIRGGVLYDPFMGTGTSAIAAIESDMQYIGSELSQEYVDYAKQRIKIRLSEPKLF